MDNKRVVQKALNLTWSTEMKPRSVQSRMSDYQSSAISRLIYDIFGGEILKTHLHKGWHFYNRIDGERIDFTVSEKNKTLADIQFEDIPAAYEEANLYNQEEDYSNLFLMFVRTFENLVGLESYRRRKAV